MENEREKFEIYFVTKCQTCMKDLGVYEADSKIYRFFNVIPSLG